MGLNWSRASAPSEERTSPPEGCGHTTPFIIDRLSVAVSCWLSLNHGPMPRLPLLLPPMLTAASTCVPCFRARTSASSTGRRPPPPRGGLPLTGGTIRASLPLTATWTTRGRASGRRTTGRTGERRGAGPRGCWLRDPAVRSGDCRRGLRAVRGSVTCGSRCGPSVTGTQLCASPETLLS